MSCKALSGDRECPLCEEKSFLKVHRIKKNPPACWGLLAYNDFLKDRPVKSNRLHLEDAKFADRLQHLNTPPRLVRVVFAIVYPEPEAEGEPCDYDTKLSRSSFTS